MTGERDEKITLSEYFRSVDRRLRSISGSRITRDILLDGRRIRQHFLSAEQAEMVIPSFTGLYVETAGQPDADFYFWTDELVPYLPEGTARGPGIWTGSDETGYLHVNGGYGLVGADHLRRRYYICLEHTGEDKNTSPEAHAMVISLFRWAMDTDMLVMHGAAVGAGGRGVLVGARGGQGKSTLAAACLVRGMDFVADDYVLLTRSGALEAKPIYRTLGMNPDMQGKIGIELPVIRRDPSRGGKLLLDASGCRFARSLPIIAVVYPSLPEEGRDREPEIVPAERGRALTQMIYSSLMQLGAFRETEVVKLMTARLGGLPAYEMRLCRDPLKNAEILEEFIRGL